MYMKCFICTKTKQDTLLRTPLVTDLQKSAEAIAAVGGEEGLDSVLAHVILPVRLCHAVDLRGKKEQGDGVDTVYLLPIRCPFELLNHLQLSEVLIRAC